MLIPQERQPMAANGSQRQPTAAWKMRQSMTMAANGSAEWRCRPAATGSPASPGASGMKVAFTLKKPAGRPYLPTAQLTQVSASSARAGTRRFRRLSALLAHTKLVAAETRCAMGNAKGA